jgi:hypothetical protein
MLEFLTLQYIGENILWIIIGAPILATLIAFALTIRAPFIAFRLIRRNRCLGGNIYCGIAQADRFMDVWMLGKWCSTKARCKNILTKDGWDPEAGRMNRIDSELVKIKVIKEVTEIDKNTGDIKNFVVPQKGRYWLRNWIIFLTLLFLRVTIFGDKFSHICIPDNFPEKKVKHLYHLILFLFTTTIVAFLFVIAYLI